EPAACDPALDAGKALGCGWAIAPVLDWARRDQSAAATFIPTSSISAESIWARDLRDATRQACERRITPSVSTLRWLALSVEPEDVMSTMMSAEPAAGAPSVAPRLSTMR